jgi:hypothetical protein
MAQGIRRGIPRRYHGARGSRMRDPRAAVALAGSHGSRSRTRPSTGPARTARSSSSGCNRTGS